MSQAVVVDTARRSPKPPSAAESGPAPAPPAPEAPAGHHADGDTEPAPRPAGWLRMLAVAGVTVAAFAGLAYLGLQSRARQAAARGEAAAATPAPDRPRVLTAKAERSPAVVEQVLPGTAAPERETAVYARTSGYLKRWLVDIGDAVKEGQLLAEIETPEVDAQLLQARAALAEAKATVERNKATRGLAGVNLARSRATYGLNAVSRQELDEAEAGEKVAAATVLVSEAAVNASAANVSRLEDLQRFQKVHAPFAGTVTARNFDAGALVVADTSTARELFHIAEVHTLRVYADVPQTFATSVKPGQPAPVFRREAPGREYKGVVARTTNAVDPATRTLRVEIDVPNQDLALLPGMYLQVRFKFDAPGRAVRVPGAAVITRGDGVRVAVVDAAGTVRYKVVQVGRDFGTTVEVVAGLTGDETLVVRPGDDLPEGTAVDVTTASAR